MSSSSRISVVVPVYNTESLVKGCLETILSQSHSDLEVLVVNDGSTDGSLDVISGIAEQDSRVKVISQPNAGLAAARNLGIERASGEYLAFVDSDDTIEPEMFAQMKQRMEIDDSDICVCQFDQVREDGQVIRTSAFPAGRTVDEYFRLVLSSRESSMACNKLFRKRLFEMEPTWFPVGLIHEDVPTVFRLFWFARRVSVVSESYYNWLWRDGTLSKTMSAKHALDLMWGFELTKKALIEWGVLEEYRPELFRRVAHFSTGLIGRYREQHSAYSGAELAQLLHDWILMLDLGNEQDLAVLRESDPPLHRRFVQILGSAGSGSIALADAYATTLLKEQLAACESRLRLIEHSTSYGFGRKATATLNKIFPDGTRRRKFARFATRKLTRQD